MAKIQHSIAMYDSSHHEQVNIDCQCLARVSLFAEGVDSVVHLVPTYLRLAACASNCEAVRGNTQSHCLGGE